MSIYETINAQLESLRLSTDRRLAWIQEQLTAATEQRIVRMRRSQLANLEQDRVVRESRLEARRGVTVGRNLLAAGVLVVEPSG